MNCEDFINKRRKLDLNEDEDPTTCPNTTAQEALDALREHFLGEDWFITDPVGGRQANTIIVYEILKRNSKEFWFEKLFKRRNK